MGKTKKKQQEPDLKIKNTQLKSADDYLDINDMDKTKYLAFLPEDLLEKEFLDVKER